MDAYHHNNSESFSEETLEAIANVESLASSLSFEQTMYDNRLSRVAVYDHDSQPENSQLPHLESIMLPPFYTNTHFPPELQDSFVDSIYEISNIQAKLTDLKDQTRLEFSFNANGDPHHFVANTIDGQTVSLYTKTNNNGEFVQYEVSDELPLSMLSALALAQQHAINGEDQPIELDESVVSLDRDPTTDLAERIITTMGNFTGRSQIETSSLFEDPAGGTPIVATLKSAEYPDKSTADSTLNLSEISGSIEIVNSSTTLTQRLSNLEVGDELAPVGTTAIRYAVQEDTVISRANSLPVIQEFDPDLDYAEWGRICKRFNGIVAVATKSYRYLDD